MLIVVNNETEEPTLLGTYVDSIEDVVRYSVDGAVHSAPADCVTVVRVELGLVERLKADRDWHQARRDELAIELSDLDEAYSAETDTAESYHSGRAEAMADAVDLLLGIEKELYSETGIE